MNVNKFFAASVFSILSVNSFGAQIDIDSLMKANAKPWFAEKIKSECDPIYSKYLSFEKSSISNNTYHLIAMGFYGKWMVCVKKYDASAPIENVTISPGVVRVSQISNSALPISIENKTFVYTNCSSTPIITQSTEQLVVQDGLTLTTKNSVKTSTSAKATLPVKIVTSELNFSRDVTFDSEKTTNETTTRTSTLQINKEIPPYTVIIANQEVKHFNSWFDFDGDLYLDGLVAKSVSYKAIVSNNLITVAGQIFNSTSQLSSLSFTQKSLDPSSCASGQKALSNVSQKISTSSEDAKSSALIELDNNAVNYKNSVLAEKPAAHDYSDGVVVTTSDVIANIQVRAKASPQEVTPCAASFQAGNGKVEFVVLPNVWSDWKTITTYVGKTNTSVSKNTSCKYEVSAELSYL